MNVSTIQTTTSSNITMNNENKYEDFFPPTNNGLATLPIKHARIYEYALFFYLNLNLLRWDYGKIFESDTENEFNCLNSIVCNLIFHTHPAFLEYIESGLKRLRLISKYTQSTLIKPELQTLLVDYSAEYRHQISPSLLGEVADLFTALVISKSESRFGF